MKLRILAPSVLAAAALALAGCSGGGDVAAPLPPEAAPLATPTAADAGATSAAGSPAATASPGAAALGDPYELIPSLVEDLDESIVAVLVQTSDGGGQGSGVVWDGERGLIVTNDHVVDGAVEVEVQLSSGERVPAEVLATDPFTDLAVIQVDRRDLPQATFAAELPRVGELAVALGNPLGFENSVTAGIVSGLHRSLGEDPFTDLIQTDAPISPGNSGGALVNRLGEVIGINSAGIPTSQNANSLGFAIPSPTVVSVVTQLLDRGEASHAFLGISSSSEGQGVVIESVSPGSAAEAAGVRAGDVVRAVDGQAIRSSEELVSILRAHVAGDVVRLTLERGGESLELTATLGERPSA